MPYIENRLVHDADAHIMETPYWLRDYADPKLRDRIEPPGYVNELRQTGDNDSQLEDIDAAFSRLSLRSNCVLPRCRSRFGRLALASTRATPL